jgi:hypothetical protein
MTKVAAAVACMLAAGVVPVGRPERPESRAIGTVRAVTSAQSAHAARSGRYAASLEQLRIAPQIASGKERFGYRFELVPGSDPARRYAYRAFPVRGERRPAFCAGASTLIYVTASGARPAIRDGRCVDRRRPLR